MEELILFHGSNVEVENPKIMINGYYKDFGYGFYCTKLEKQAKRLALSRKGDSVVNRYTFRLKSQLKYLLFDKMTDEWLDFIILCRKGYAHGYDIVEGPMADDTIWDFIEDFAENRISREVFWSYAKFKYPTHQIVFCTSEALECIKFSGSDKV